jgi:ubiquinone/menaquinone biosynthesis C-methylase UbiE
MNAVEGLLRSNVSTPLGECHVLDVGCGGAEFLLWLKHKGATSRRLFGIDLRADRIEVGFRRDPELQLSVGNAEETSFPDAKFDVVSAFTVFSSILCDEMSAALAAEMTRVLKPSGVIVWYDLRYPNPWNRQVRAMTLNRIQRIFPDLTLDLMSITLLPPFADRMTPATSWTYHTMSRLPLLRSHYVGVLRQPSPSS